MKTFFFIISCIFFTSFINAQDLEEYREVDKVAMNIPREQTNTTAEIAAYIGRHFNSDSKKVRAIYTWVTNNIKYDKDSIHRVILDEDREQKVTYALKRRKGVCENFAEIFFDLCIRMGIRSYVVLGYSKQNGSVIKTPHAWCAALIDNNWYLFDPTWDAGFLKGGVFTNQIQTNYFLQLPINFIQTHLPLDPLFQFLGRPVTFKEFSRGLKINDNHTNLVHYTDSINAYEKSDSLSRYLAAISRIEKYDWPVSMIDIRLKQLKFEIEVKYEDKDMSTYNAAVADYNAGIAIYNTYLNYRNNQFKPAKKEDEVRILFNNIKKKITEANLKLIEINQSKANLQLDTGDIQKKLTGLFSDVTLQEVFYKNYLNTEKLN